MSILSSITELVLNQGKHSGSKAFYALLVSLQSIRVKEEKKGKVTFTSFTSVFATILKKRLV